MNATELMIEIASKGVHLSVDGERLNIRAPKGVLTSTITSSLAQHKTEIVSLLRQRARDDRGAPFPLTDIQKAYWVGRSDAMPLGNVGCHFYQEFENAGVDLARMERAWQRLIERHDMLRATILPDARQQILQEVPPYHIEVTALDPLAVREQMSHRVFDPAQWPLFDIRATRTSERVTRLHVSIDLFIADAASIYQLFREWSQLYRNSELGLPPLDFKFRDYVLAEQAMRGGERYRAAETYWFNRLATLPSAPDLPLAKAPATVTKPKFVRRSGKLEGDTWRQLKSHASQAGLTSSGVLCAAFAEVLRTWSKNSHFTLNVTLFNRLPLHHQVNDIVGDFTSTILLEVDSSLDTFESRARRLQSQLAEDLNYVQVSGVHVLQGLNRIRGGEGAGSIPIVFTSLLVHRLGDDQWTSPTAWLGEEIFSVSQTPQVWLDHHVFEESGTLFYNWDAVEELFPAGLLDDMFGAFGDLLRRLAEDKEVWHSSPLALLPPVQLRQRALLNATQAPVPEGLLHSGFAANAARIPRQPAIISTERTLTYAELDRISSKLARQLCVRGARPNTLVAVLMEKGWEQIAAVLGVLKSGAAYLPIEASLPAERGQYVLEHGAVKLAVSQRRLDGTLERPDKIVRLYVEDELSNGDESPLEALQKPDDLAYVIYTSGSTGLPKGVMIDHRGALNTIADINSRFAVCENDRVLAISSLSFDLSVYDIFGTLAAGGTIVLPDAAATRDPGAWLQLMRRERVTVWNSVPALMRMLVDYAGGRPDVLPSSLRLALLSGDWIPISLPDQIRSLNEGVRVVSLGGATEASIWSILYPIDQVDRSWKSIPYGVPMHNQSFRVLNERSEDCPIWVPGRLFIGGVGLAKGYWRDEENTRRRFMLHPRTGERLYDTGDLGRYLPDGNIEFLGREDFQVKIQGHRIELGEIEIALAANPEVDTAVVMAVGELRGDQRLVAFVKPKRSSADMAMAVEKLEFKLSEAGLRSEGLNGTATQLTKPKFDGAFTKPYTERRTHRAFSALPIPLDRISEFLSVLLQIPADGSPLPKYRYPSAGSLYPVQTYLYVKPDRVEGLEPGCYYYHPKEHQLRLLADDVLDPSLHFPENQAIFESSAFSLFLVGELGAIAPLYGDLGRDFCLIEAGYMSQLLMMVAPACGLGLCPIGSLEFEQLRKSLRLNESGILLHSMLGGGIGAQSVGKTDLVSELRAFLKKKLPEYMVPSAFVLLDHFPLTANGKIDRKALPAIEHDRPVETAYVPARSEMEHTLAEIAGEILDVEKIGVHDNFFEAGATSLHLVQFQRRLRGLLDRDIPMTAIFQHPTIERLAEFLSSGSTAPKFRQQAQERARRHRAALNRKHAAAEENGNG